MYRLLITQLLNTTFYSHNGDSGERYNEGFAMLPHRWIVERTLSWLMRNRRLSKDYERMVQPSEAFIKVAMIRLVLRRLAREV